MHPAPIYRQTDELALLAELERQPFCLIAASVAGRPMIAHAPVIQARAEGRLCLEFHLSARNPMAEALADGFDAIIVSLGPDAYVSPDWYGQPDTVPTWDYVSVEAEGRVTQMGSNDTLGQLTALTAMMEAPLAPKPPWTLDKVSAPRMEALRRGLVGGRMRIDRLEGTFKLSQDKDAAAQAGVLAALGDHPIADRIRRRG